MRPGTLVVADADERGEVMVHGIQQRLEAHHGSPRPEGVRECV
jgi:hypothetical protein